MTKLQNVPKFYTFNNCFSKTILYSITPQIIRNSLLQYLIRAKIDKPGISFILQAN